MPAGITTAVSGILGTREAQERVIAQLESVAALKESEITTWLDDLQNDLTKTLTEPTVAVNAQTLLQGTGYNLILRESVRQQFQDKIVQTGRFETMFIVDLEGQVVVSTDPGQDGDTYDDEAFFREGLQEPSVQLSKRDFPSPGQVSVIAVGPIPGLQGQTMGVLVGYVGLERLNAVLGERAGLGETGETYLVSPDRVLLSESRFEGYMIGETRVDTEGANAALQDLTNGAGTYDGYRGVPVIGAYHWLPDLQVALLVEQARSEALGASIATLGLNTVVTIIGVLIAILVGLLVTRGIATPLANLAETATQIASGDLEHVADVEQEDEIGTLGQAFNGMTTRLRDMLRNEQDQREYLETTVREYVEYMEAVGQGDLTLQMDIDGNGIQNDMLSVLGHTLNRTTATVQDMTRRITDAANNLSSSAAEILAATTQQASGASEQSAAISQTTTTVDELKTIAEQSVARAQDVANASQRTVEVSRAGQRSVEEIIMSMREIRARVEGIAENILALSEQTQQIGEIISTVNDIASQSNILALNASVEAARAGEYGKGFAVVAVEVRSLAEQSRQATAQIKTILSDIQRATNATVMATEEGTKGVDEGVNLTEQAGEAIIQLAAVIQESAQAAVQMVAGGRQQSAGVEQVAIAMQNISQSTVQSLASTRQAEKAARELNELARSLTEIVEQYRVES
jgi:methyl-accepting chemotaxis protein